MGMYATIGGEEIKYVGLLAEACHKCGIEEIEASITIPRSQATQVLTSMVTSIEKGRPLVHGGNIQGQSVYRLARDAAVMALLFDWVVFPKEGEEELVFI